MKVIRCDSKALVEVAVFKYDLHSGCSYTDSTYHSQLPPPSDSRRPIHSFVCDSGLRVGCEFLYGHPFDYTIKGKVATITSVMGNTSSHGCIEPEFEVPKTARMAMNLSNHFGSDFFVAVLSGHAQTRFTPFSGGGT